MYDSLNRPNGIFKFARDKRKVCTRSLAICLTSQFSPLANFNFVRFLSILVQFFFIEQKSVGFQALRHTQSLCVRVYWVLPSSYKPNDISIYGCRWNVGANAFRRLVHSTIKRKTTRISRQSYCSIQSFDIVRSVVATKLLETSSA